MQTEVGIRRIVRGEVAIQDKPAPVIEAGHVVAAHEERRVHGAQLVGGDVLGLRVVEAMVADVKLGALGRAAINAHMTVDGYVLGLGVVFRFIAVDVDVTDMNGDIVTRGRDAVIVMRAARGRDLDRLTSERALRRSLRHDRRRKQEKN